MNILLLAAISGIAVAESPRRVAADHLGFPVISIGDYSILNIVQYRNDT